MLAHVGLRQNPPLGRETPVPTSQLRRAFRQGFVRDHAVPNFLPRHFIPSIHLAHPVIHGCGIHHRHLAKRPDEAIQLKLLFGRKRCHGVLDFVECAHGERIRIYRIAASPTSPHRTPDRLLHTLIYKRRSLRRDAGRIHRRFDFRRAHDAAAKQLREIRDVLFSSRFGFVVGDVERRQAPADRASRGAKSSPSNHRRARCKNHAVQRIPSPARIVHK